MTVDDVNDVLARLRDFEASGDMQAAAAGLQTLLVEALRAIADGAADPQGLAAAALVGVDEELSDE